MSELISKESICSDCLFFVKGKCLVRDKKGRFCKLKVRGLKPTGWFVFMEDGRDKRVRVWNNEYNGSWAKDWHYISPIPKAPARYLAYAFYVVGKALGIDKVGKYLIYDARASSIIHYALIERKIDYLVTAKALLNLASLYPIASLLEIREDNDEINYFLMENDNYWKIKHLGKRF